MEPGSQLVVKAKQLEQDEKTTTFKAEGAVDGKLHVSARLVLERYNLAETNPDDAPLDERARNNMRSLFQRLYRPVSMEQVQHTSR